MSEDNQQEKADDARATRAAPAAPIFNIVGDPGPLFGALAKAQGAFGKIRRSKHVTIRTKTSGTYDFDYAPLEEIIAATQPALAANGLALTQLFAGRVQHRQLRTILAHSSGAYIEATIGLVEGDDIKNLGSEITYMRRYSMAALLNVAADDDDDGSAATGDHVTQRTPATPPPVQRQQRPREPKAEPKPPQEPKKPPQEPPARQVSQPPPAEPEPEPDPGKRTTEIALTPATAKRLQQLCIVLSMRADRVQELCRSLTGRGPKELSESDGQKIVEHLQRLKAERDQA